MSNEALKELRVKLISFFNEKKIDYDPSQNTKNLYIKAVKHYEYPPLSDENEIFGCKVTRIDLNKSKNSENNEIPDEPLKTSFDDNDLNDSPDDDSDLNDSSDDDSDLNDSTDEPERPEPIKKSQKLKVHHKKTDNIETPEFEVVQKSENKKDDSIIWLVVIVLIVFSLYYFLTRNQNESE